MKKNRLTLIPLSFVVYACSPTVESLDDGTFDSNGDRIADDLGTPLDVNPKDGVVDQIDINLDGKLDGMGVDTDGDKRLDALVFDLDCDGFFEALDVDGDLIPDGKSRLAPPGGGGGCVDPGTGGAAGSGGAKATGGSSTAGTGGVVQVGTGGTQGGSGGSILPSTGGMPAMSLLGMGDYQGSGRTQGQYAESKVYRDGVGYMFIANGWGPGWQSHDISWNGTSFTVHSLNGSQGGNYEPAGYPTIFCGKYSMKDSPGQCGLPAQISSLTSLKTGWKWKPNGDGQYNAAWDIWLSNDGNGLSSYLMVWLRDPPGQQPAGATQVGNATVEGLPGTWTIWTGNVNGLPIVNYVQPQGNDKTELEFDVLAVYADAKKRNFNLPGSHILSVAIGFEIWNGPVSEVATEDFYVLAE